MDDLVNLFDDLITTTRERVAGIRDPQEKEALRIEVLGRKGKLAAIFSRLTEIPPEQRSEVGRKANATKSALEALFAYPEQKSGEPNNKQLLDALTWKLSDRPVGHAHPLSQFTEMLSQIFSRMGFSILDSPELEDEKHNFDLLHIPPDHPSRDAWDTFFVRGAKASGHDAILRTHTSPMQIRGMKNRKPPVRILVPGRVFRHEASDMSHSAVFYQCEGFVIDKGIRFSDLKGVLATTLREIFGADVRIRFRPHFYPFVEPGMDVDMWYAPKGKEARWLEMLGSGMIHPVVMRNMGIDPDVYSGFAFGMGIDRLAMLYWGIDDIRLLYGANLKLLSQF